MKFLELEVTNWALYRTTQVISFDSTPEKPVILINAFNDKGKTSLFYSIRYALFGERGLRTHTKDAYRHLSEWPNFYSARDGDGELCVELSIQFDDQTVKRIQRKRSFTQTPTGEVISLGQKDQLTIFENNEPMDVGKNVEEINRWIEANILPFNAAQFFLFDGEVIQKYTENPEEQVQKAIRQVLGLSEIDNAKVDLNELLDTIRDEKTKKAKITTKDEKTKNKIEELEDDIKTAKQLLKDSKSEKASAERLVIENNKIINQFKDLRDKKDRQVLLTNTINQNKKALEGYVDTLKEKRDFGGLLLLNPLLKIISITEETPPSKEQWESKTASYILDKSHENCVCDEPINDKVKGILKDKILNLRDNPFSSLKRLVETISSAYRPDGLDVELNAVVNKISEVEDIVTTDENERKNISKEIVGNKDIGEDLKRKESANIEAIKRIGEIEGHLPKLQKQLDSLYGKLTSLTNQIKSSSANKELDEVMQFEKLIDQTQKVFDKAFHDYFEKEKPKLEKEITNVFKKLTNAPTKYKAIHLDNNFAIHIEREDGTLLQSHRYSPSAGAGQIAATAVIAGFNKFTTRKSPVVIDTPAGRLDPIHTENLLGFYPQMSEQVIILPQPDEIDEKDEEILSDFISVRYDIIAKPDDPNQSIIVRRKE
jgi:DNA sulfur modification protein DndD